MEKTIGLFHISWGCSRSFALSEYFPVRSEVYGRAISAPVDCDTVADDKDLARRPPNRIIGRSIPK